MKAPPADPAGPADHPVAAEDGRKLTVYLGERTRSGSGAFAADELLDLFGRQDVATSIVLRGIEGYGVAHHLRSDRSLTLSEDPPLVAMAVDSTARITNVMEQVEALQPRGVITLERAQLLRGVTDLPVAQPELPDQAKLTVYLGRQQRAGRAPAHVAVCDLMFRSGLAGASVFLGVDGTSAGTRQRARFFDRNADVPLMIIAVGDRHRIAAVLPDLGTLLREPMLTLERVAVCKREGQLLQRPHELPASDADGLALWQKLTIYSSESTLHRATPIHRAVVRRLRAAGVVRGATAIRGIWGFHGDHRPHGDAMLRLHRSVPVATVLVDSPDRIATSFDLIDEITAEHGLVTSEMVPGLVSIQPERRHGGLRLARHRY